jgi:hypothetical protein
MMAVTLRQYRTPQKADFIRDYPVESRSAATLLGDELNGLEFHFATAYQEHDRGRSVRIEFHGGERVVWVDAKGNRAMKVLVKSPTEFFSRPRGADDLLS